MDLERCELEARLNAWGGRGVVVAFGVDLVRACKLESFSALAEAEMEGPERWDDDSC